MAIEKVKRPYLFVDGFNNFIRHFMVNQTLNNRSEPVGGVVGFIRFLNKLNNTLAPEKVFVIWEAGGASSRRKSIYPLYKQNRAKIKTFTRTKAGKDNTSDSLRVDNENKVQQLVLLNKLLKQTPICQVFVNNTEADDVIGYLVKEKFANLDCKKVIVSNDKDFYQLLDDPNVLIFDPAKKTIITENELYEKYSIAARNFCLAKTLVGDGSDNIEGVPGVGFKTVSKRFKVLSDKETDVTLNDILTECQTQISNKSKLKTYKSILENENLLKRNWKLMYLNSSTLSASQIKKINYIVDNHEPSINKMNFMRVLIDNGINIFNDFDDFINNLKYYLTL